MTKQVDTKNVEREIKAIKELVLLVQKEVHGFQETYSELLGVFKSLEQKVEIDSMTGLLTKKAFFKNWQSLLNVCREKCEDVGLIVVDIDHFKNVNDQHGHEVGDHVIMELANSLKSLSGPECFVGRFGGEEFVIGLKGDAKTISDLSEFIRRKVEGASTEVKFTVSVGWAHSAPTERAGIELFGRADKALYQAKNSGRNSVEGYRLAA